MLAVRRAATASEGRGLLIEERIYAVGWSFCTLNVARTFDPVTITIFLCCLHEVFNIHT